MKLLLQTDENVSISLHCHTLQNISSVDTQRLKGKMQKELSVIIDYESWEDVWRHDQITVCSYTKETQ